MMAVTGEFDPADERVLHKFLSRLVGGCQQSLQVLCRFVLRAEGSGVKGWLWAAGWSGRIRRFSLSVVVVFAVLFVWLRWTSVGGIDRFGNGLAPDFSQFVVAGELAASGQIGRTYDEPFFAERVNTLFGLPRQADSYPFLYPPFVPWLMIPVSWLPYAVVATVELLAMAALAVWLAWSVARRLLENGQEALNAACLLVASIPAIRCLLYGQNGFVGLAIVWGGFLTWREGRDGCAGVIFALGAYKPQLFVGVWLWLLVTGTNRMRLGWLVGLMGVFAFGCVGGGVALWRQWVEAVLRMRDSEALRGQMLSWWVASGWMGEGLGVWLLARAGLWFLLATVWLQAVLRLGRKRAEAAFFIALWGWAWITPRFSQYDAVMLYPALVWLWKEATENRARASNVERAWIICLITLFYMADFFTLIKLPVLTILSVAIFAKWCIQTRQFQDASITCRKRSNSTI